MHDLRRSSRGNWHLGTLRSGRGQLAREGAVYPGVSTIYVINNFDDATDVHPNTHIQRCMHVQNIHTKNYFDFCENKSMTNAAGSLSRFWLTERLSTRLKSLQLDWA